MRTIHVATSRNATRALDAAYRRSDLRGCELRFEPKGQWLPSRLESPI